MHSKILPSNSRFNYLSNDKKHSITTEKFLLTYQVLALFLGFLCFSMVIVLVYVFENIFIE